MNSQSLDRNTAIAIIESLRSGIPTRKSTRELPDLRPNLTAKIIQDLEQFATGSYPKGRLIWGAYGQGKTHELTCIEHLALDRGFAVSKVTLSRELSGQHLFRLYGKIASSIKTPHSKLLGIQHQLNQKQSGDLPDSPIQDVERYTHPLPAIILEDYFYAEAEEPDLLYGDLLGSRIPISEIKRIHKLRRGIPFPKIPNFGVLKHGQAYFEVMADIIQWCGYKGWVILIDEIELIARLGKVGRLNSYKNLNWLLNWSQDKPFPFYCVGGVASPLMDLWLGSEKRLPDQEEIPKLAGQKFSEDEAETLGFFFQRSLNDQQCPIISPLDRSQLQKALEMLVKVHEISYAWKADINVNELIDSIGASPLRTHIRALLESLDIKFLHSVDFRPMINSEEFELAIEEEDFFHEVDDN